MIKVLLADDEPLVLVGLQSVLNWEDYDAEIVGTAHNGERLVEMVESLRPDIVIADIKMPRKTGLEALEECRERFGEFPLFIMLTSYEEFDYVKVALQHRAVDYLVKLELSPGVLGDALSKAIGILRERGQPTAPDTAVTSFSDKFFIRLLHGLFDQEEQYLIQRQELGLDFSFAAYAVCYCSMAGSHDKAMEAEKQARLYSSTLRMLKETINKFMACYITGLDMHHFAVIFCLSEQELPQYRAVIENVLKQSAAILHNYFAVNFHCAVGAPVADPFAAHLSFSGARRLLPSATGERPILFQDRSQPDGDPFATFDFSLFREQVAGAFEELEADAVMGVLSTLAEQIENSPGQQAQALDLACSLLYTALAILPDGEKNVSAIFAGQPDGYRCIYHMRTAEQVAWWVRELRDGLCGLLRSQRQNYKHRTVLEVQQYIRQNLRRKLTLHEVAALFGFSPNYLSQLFARHAECGFVEFITEAKISAAKAMLLQGQYKTYEIAEHFGFDNAYYFSKVFKKVVGCSPREFVQKQTAPVE